MGPALTRARKRARGKKKLGRVFCVVCFFSEYHEVVSLSRAKKASNPDPGSRKREANQVCLNVFLLMIAFFRESLGPVKSGIVKGMRA